MHLFKSPSNDMRQAMNIHAQNLRNNIALTAGIVTVPFTIDLLMVLEEYVKELRTVMEDLESNNAEQAQTTLDMYNYPQEEQEEQKEQEEQTAFCPRCFSTDKSDRKQVVTRPGVAMTCSNPWHFKERDLDVRQES